MNAPVFGSDKGGWFFWDMGGELAGPYGTEQRATEKYEEYLDYTMNAPSCHHL